MISIDSTAGRPGARKPAAWLLLCAALSLLPAAGAADADQSFDIPAGSLAASLNRLAETSGLQLIYDTGMAKGLSSPRLRGNYTPEAALRQLLRNSGLTYRLVGNGTVVIEKAPLNTNRAPDTMPPVTVSGRAEFEANDPYNPSYNRTSASTAMKTDTPILQTPMSIQVVPEAVLEDQQAYRLQDAVKNVSGVQQAFISGGFDNFIVRGFDLGTFQYRNGVRIPDINFDLANVQQVEVLKGPSSGLYGRIEPGGMINVVTRRPLAEPYYSVEQRFGSYDYYRTQARATGAITQDKSLLYGFDLSYLNSDSFREHSFNDRVFVAPSLTWKPFERTEVNLTLERLEEDRVYDSGLPATSTGIVPLPITRQFDNPGLFDTHENTLVDFNWTHRFNDDWKIQNGMVSVFEDFDSNETYACGFNPATNALSRCSWFGKETFDLHTTYLNLTGKFDTFGVGHSVLLGGDFFNQNKVAYATDDFIDDVNIYNPVFPSTQSLIARFDNLPLEYFRDQQGGWYNNREDTWYGLYFQDQLSFFGDRLHILGGGRYDWAHVRQDSAYFTPLAKNAETYANFSPRVGITVQPQKWLAIYGNFVESFGANNGSSATGEVFDPQQATQFEAGVKTELFDGRLTSTLAYYHLTKTNILAPDPSRNNFRYPIGEARSQGIELDVSGQLSDAVSLIANYAYTDARILKDAPANVGHHLPNVPEHSGSLWLKYAFQQATLQGFSIGAGLYGASAREGDAANSYRDGSYVRLDLFGAYKRRIGPTNLTAQVNINNVTDTEYFIMRDKIRNLPAEPLTVLGSLRLEY